MTGRRRTFRGTSVAGIFAALASLQAHAATPGASSAAAGVATATVISPLRVVAVAAMDFGTITHAPGTGGTVTVSPGGAGAQFSGGASGVCTGSDCADAHAARFAVSGEPQRNYAIGLPATVVATGTTPSGSGAPTLTVSGLTLSAASGNAASGTGRRLDARGFDRFEVGGTITLPADLPAARYRASFAVIVSYI
jgi:hypothetical protein